MTPLMTLLAWTLVLAFVNLVTAAVARRLQEPPGWAAGARDQPPPSYHGVAARLGRAEANLMETLPLFAAAALVCHAAGREGSLADWGATLYLWGRVIYLPVYALGIPYLRTVIWVAASAGLCMVISACLVPG